MKRIALASLVALAAGLPTLSHAFDGQIDFWGSVSDTTCEVNPGDANQDVRWTKPFKPADFTTNGQPATTSEMKAFSVRLANCTYDTTAADPKPKAFIKFDDLNTKVDKVHGGLMNQFGQAQGYAENVQVNIFTDLAGTEKVMLGSSTAGKKFDINTTTKSVSLDYYANLVRQDTVGAAGVRPGIFRSMIRYQIAYE